MATYFSNQTGLWSSTSTWLTAGAGVYSIASALPAGAPPVSFAGDKIIILAPHVVTYDVQGCFGDETSTYIGGLITTAANRTSVLSNGIVLSGGTLKASRTVNTELTARGTIFISASSTFDWGTTSDPITAVNANIILHYMSTINTLSASTAAAGMYLLGAVSTDNQYFYNNIYLNGAVKKRNTTLALSAASGATTLSAVDTTGWKVGDRLVVATEYISNISSTTAGVLSATYIQTINGNQFTISPALNSSKSAGTSIGNFTSNVTVKSFNEVYASYGIYIALGLGQKVDINYISCFGIGNGITTPVGWCNYSYSGTRNAAAQTGTPLGFLSFLTTFSQIPAFSLKGIVCDNPGNAAQHYGFHINGRLTETITLEDCAIFSPNGNSYLANANFLASTYFKNCNVYRAVYGVTHGSQFPNSVIIENCNFDCQTSNAPSMYGLKSLIFNSKIRVNSYLTAIDGIQDGTIRNTQIYHTRPDGSLLSTNVNSVGKLEISNCNFYYQTGTTVTALSSVTKTAGAMSNKTAQSCQVNVFQANGNLFDFRKFNYYHYSQADLLVRKNGITSFKIKPEVVNTEFYNYFTIAGVINTPQRIKANLRFDSTYGSDYPPSISFVGAGVDVVCACAATPNVWQPIDITVTPTTTDDIIMTVTCKSLLSTGFVWLDGIPIYPYIQDVRWYGFDFDTATDRTIDSFTTLTEQQVSAINDVYNLDYLYDASNYWSINNPLSSSYLDLYTKSGSIIDFGSKNIIFHNNASTGFSYSSALNTLTIKSSILSGGNNFNVLKTTGNITLSGCNISYITIQGNVYQAVPFNLTSVNLTGKIQYNTNSASQVTYTNSSVVSATNIGSANVTIKTVNSTITYA